MGQGLILRHNGAETEKVPSRSFIQGMDEALSAIKVLQHGLTPPLRVWAGDWVLVRQVSDGVEDEGSGPWSILFFELVWRAKLA